MKRKQEEFIHAAFSDKEKGHIGTALGDFYGGLFSNPKNVDVWLKTICECKESLLKEIPEDPLVLGIGSGPGLVVIRKLLDEGFSPTLILSDIIPETMKEHYPNYNPEDYIPEVECHKVQVDNKELANPENELGQLIQKIGKKVNIVIARSVLHYESSLQAQKEILEQIKMVLSSGGVFFNQELSFPNPEEVALAKMERCLVGKKTYYATQDVLIKMHQNIFGKENVSNSLFVPSYFVQTGEDYKKRFNLSEKEYNEIAKEIRFKITNSKALQESNNVKILNGNDWLRITPFTLLANQKI
jgi:uncharacterized protein YfkK (UPF0435 family)